MAKNKNKKSTPKYSGGISTKGYKPGGFSAKAASEEKEESRGVFGRARDWFCGLSKRCRVIICAVLCVAILAGAAIPLVSLLVNRSEERNFDYMKSDISDYISFPEELYTDFPLILDIAKPHEKRADGSGVSDVEIVMLSMLAADKGGKTIGGMIMDYEGASVVITPGDDICFWYRGYIIEDGREVEITSLSNFYKEESNIRSEANTYTVGGGMFSIAGIENGLIGKNIKDYATFKKITEGNVTAGQVVYISCERVPVGGTAADKQTGTSVRIDLTDAENAALWLPILEGAKIGGEVDDFRVTVDGVAYDYSKTKVEFVTECENGEKKPTLTIEGYAPYDFSVPQLRNETIYVDIYISGIQKRNEWHLKGLTEYTLDYDWTDEYIQSKLDMKDPAITAEELDKYEGESLAEKYKAYIKETVYENYRESKRQMAEDAMWQYFCARAEVIKYPENKVNEIFNEYRNDLTTRYTQSGGVITDPYTSKSVTCESLDEYAVIYYKLQYAEDQDWENYLTKHAQSLVKERLVMYYLIKEEKLCTNAEFVKWFEKTKQNYVDEYIKQDTTDTSKFTEEEYEEYVEECKKKIFDTYDDEYFTETTYFEIVMNKMLSYSKIYTLDEISAREKWVFDFMTGWV